LQPRVWTSGGRSGCAGGVSDACGCASSTQARLDLTRRPSGASSAVLGLCLGADRPPSASDIGQQGHAGRPLGCLIPLRAAALLYNSMRTRTLLSSTPKTRHRVLVQHFETGAMRDLRAGTALPTKSRTPRRRQRAPLQQQTQRGAHHSQKRGSATADVMENRHQHGGTPPTTKCVGWLILGGRQANDGGATDGGQGADQNQWGRQWRVEGMPNTSGRPTAARGKAEDGGVADDGRGARQRPRGGRERAGGQPTTAGWPTAGGGKAHDRGVDEGGRGGSRRRRGGRRRAGGTPTTAGWPMEGGG